MPKSMYFNFIQVLQFDIQLSYKLSNFFTYSTTFEQDLINKEKYLRLKQSFGDIWEIYLSDTTPLLAEPYLNYYRGMHDFADSIEMMARTSLVHVNFNKLEANKITKDAKVTFPDALGNIGGTFGVFLGLSFVGILDFVILIWKMLTKVIMKKFKSVKKSTKP